MGVQKKTRKFAEVKRVIGKKDARRKENIKKADEKLAAAKKTGPSGELVRDVPQMPSQMFFSANEALVPPYSVLVDSSFFNRAVQMKLPILETMMDCLYASCNVIVTDCIMAELESLGPRFSIATRVARDERWERVKCQHKGHYGDDCLFDRAFKDRIYIVATQVRVAFICFIGSLEIGRGLEALTHPKDKGLQSRLRKLPGVPILKVGRGKFFIERLPGALE